MVHNHKKSLARMVTRHFTLAQRRGEETKENQIIAKQFVHDFPIYTLKFAYNMLHKAFKFWNKPDKKQNLTYLYT